MHSLFTAIGGTLGTVSLIASLLLGALLCAGDSHANSAGGAAGAVLGRSLAQGLLTLSLLGLVGGVCLLLIGLGLRRLGASGPTD